MITTYHYDSQMTLCSNTCVFCQDCSVSLHWSSKSLAYVKASFVYPYETGQMVHALLGFIYKVANIMARSCCWNEDGCLFREKKSSKEAKVMKCSVPKDLLMQ